MSDSKNKRQQHKPKHSTTKHHSFGKISEQEAKIALRRSGYLLEHRIESLLNKRRWYVEPNSAYEDDETRKSRELDMYAIHAMRLGSGKNDLVFSSMLIECINNPQPIAFITKNPLPVVRKWAVEKIKGVFDPESVFVSESGKSLAVRDLLNLHNYHHYCKGRIATQFCSFAYKDGKKEWMASHEESHFTAFQTLVKALEFKFGKLSLTPGDHINWEFLHPVVVVQGELIDVRSLGGSLELRKANHIKFQRTVIWKGEERGYIIDVVTERHFPAFVALLENELRRARLRVTRNAAVIKSELRRKYAAPEQSQDIVIASPEDRIEALPSAEAASAPEGNELKALS